MAGFGGNVNSINANDIDIVADDDLAWDDFSNDEMRDVGGKDGQ